MEIITTTPNTLSADQILQIDAIAAAAFGRAASDDSMFVDTRRHIAGSDTIQLAVIEDIPVALAMYRKCLGGYAIELAGRAILPEYQAQGIGTHLLKQYIVEEQPKLLATYTRNPAILKMLCKITPDVFPIAGDGELQDYAREMPGASLLDDYAVYHIDRYNEDGLYEGNDPALRPLESTILMRRFRGLQSVRNALVVTARVQYCTWNHNSQYRLMTCLSHLHCVLQTCYIEPNPTSTM